MMRSKFSRAAWTLLERLVARGGSRPVELIVPFLGADGEWDFRGGRDAGREATIRSLIRRGLVSVRFDPDAPDPPIDIIPERMTITDHGRAMLAEHQARRKPKKARGAA